MKGINPSNEQQMLRRLHALHLKPQLRKKIVQQIRQWTEKSGTEWTVKRLKDLKTDFIRILAGQDRSSEWISYSKGLPTGVFGRLFRLGLANTQMTTSVLNALMSYTAFLASKETEAQLSKFYGSLVGEPVDQNVLQSIFSEMLPKIKTLRVQRKTLSTLRDYCPSYEKNCPTVSGGTVSESEWLDTTNCLTDTYLGRTLYRKYQQVRTVTEPLEPFLTAKLRRLPPYFWDEDKESIQNTGFAGKIGHIQEPGFKLRSVANPFRVYQLALSRLGDQLYELINDLSWDCTHDQSSGTEWALSKIRTNRMFAVDLSDATNQFPLDLQLMLLQNLEGILPEDVSLFAELSRSIWLSPTHGAVQWTKGQPLGLYPSFAAFALTHGILVSSLERKHGYTGNGETFRILGDDIVISDLAVYKSYREVLENLGVSVSESKTLTSDSITEFGGRVISRDHIMTLGKWRQSSDRSFLDIVANVGPRYVKYLPSRQRKVAEFLLPLAKPLGLNMNPYGITALVREARFKLLEHFIKSDLDFPLYSKDPWIATLNNSSYAYSMVKTHVTIRELTARLDNVVPESSREAPKITSEVLSRVSNSTGVPLQPSIQFQDLASPYTDILERIRRIASDTGLINLRSKLGDPRGSSTLELWEARMKSVHLSHYHMTDEEAIQILNRLEIAGMDANTDTREGIGG